MTTDDSGPAMTRFGAMTKLLLTVPEAAQTLGISRSAFYELLLAGKIRSVKIGRARRIPFAMLEEFVARQLADQWSA